MKSHSDTEVDPNKSIMSFQKRNDMKYYQWYLQRRENQEVCIFIGAIFLITLHMICNFIFGSIILCFTGNEKECLPWYYRAIGVVICFFEWRYFLQLIKWLDKRDYEMDMKAAEKKFTPQQVKRLKEILEVGYWEYFYPYDSYDENLDIKPLSCFKDEKNK